MKKALLVFIFLVLLVLVFYRYKFTEDQCLKIGGEPIVGQGWTRVYAGCSPKLSK